MKSHHHRHSNKIRQNTIFFSLVRISLLGIIRRMRYDTSWRHSTYIWTSSYHDKMFARDEDWHKILEQVWCFLDRKTKQTVIPFLYFFVDRMEEGLLAAKFSFVLCVIFIIISGGGVCVCVCFGKEKKCFVNVLLIFLQKSSLYTSRKILYSFICVFV